MVTCTDSKVLFYVSSLEKIFLSPSEILKDIEAFWKTEMPFILVKGWEPPGYPIHLVGIGPTLSAMLFSLCH